MNTPAHLIFGLASFGKTGNPRVTSAALVGAFIPDLSLYAMFAWSTWVKGISPHTVFREYYYSPEWQQVFAIDNSFILWGVVLIFALWGNKPVLIAFSGAAFVHLCLDFPLHNHDARMHFWPLTNWVFISPFSYWDTQFHAGAIAPLELAVSMILCAALLARYVSAWSRALIVMLATIEVMATGFFGWVL